MTPEKLLDALTDIDSAAIRSAHAEESGTRRAGTRRFTLLIAAVIALVAMTACAFASNEVANWLQHFFAGRTIGDLSQPQLDYIADNEQYMTEPQENNGYTIELASYMTSGKTTYVTLNFTAPKNVNLTQTPLDFDIDIDAEYGRYPAWTTIRYVDDQDGLNYTESMILIIEAQPYWTIPEWYIHIPSINTIYYDEATQTHHYPILAEGPWDFTISLENADTRGVELITEPIKMLVGIPAVDNESYSFEMVNVSSLVLGPLDLIIQHDWEEPAFPQFVGTITWSAIELHIFAAMKDGSTVEFTNGHSWIQGETNLLAESPIVLDEVDYLYLADGTKLMMPELNPDTMVSITPQK